jgi:hypothetical protein
MSSGLVIGQPALISALSAATSGSGHAASAESRIHPPS